MKNTVWLIPWLPLFGFLINGVLGKKIRNEKVIGLIASLASTGSFLLLLLTAYTFVQGGLEPYTVHLFDWISVGDLQAPFAYRVDRLSLTMVTVVTFVGSLIHYYSIGYMHDDPGFARYFAYLNLFMFSMLNLVLADNLVLLFLGWEGVGLCSYLLIGFWYEDPEKAAAGMKAFIVNRIGDGGFLIGIFLIFGALGTVTFSQIDATLPTRLANGEISTTLLTVIALALFLGACGKSAQIPLYVWLPDAMAGPTPVSALIHAATMVTAGVFMIGRVGIIFLNAPAAMTVVAIVGALTALFAATMGVLQNDIKKVLAYSTVSQLGYMFLAMGVGAFSAGIFHLGTHAFFKALLFLGSGSVIMAMHHQQDIRGMGNLRRYIRITYFTFLTATLAISGIPGFSGFFSKDEILWKAYSTPNPYFPWLGPVLWGVGVLTAGMTAFYMFRLLFLTFFGEERMDSHTREHIHESPLWMTVPLMVLAFFSVVAGYIGLPAFLGTNFFHHWLAPVWEGMVPVAEAGHHHGITLEIGLMGGSVAVALIGIGLAFRRYVSGGAVPPADEEYAGLAKVVYHKYYVDEIYEKGPVRLSKGIGSFFWKRVDELLIDGFLNGTGRVAGWLGSKIRLLQTGIVHDYALSFIVGVGFSMGLILFYVLR